MGGVYTGSFPATTSTRPPTIAQGVDEMPPAEARRTSLRGSGLPIDSMRADIVEHYSVLLEPDAL